MFLTESRDPQGNALTFAYDGSLRLVSVTDALGQVTTLSYANTDPLKITQVTDPFGRVATLTYDGSGRIASITDLLGLTSSFTYRSGDVISAMTTPYGTTTVASGEAEGVKRWAETTDPLGGKERVEYGSASVFVTEPGPTGMTTYANDNHHNSSYWDKRAMAVAPADPASATDYLWAKASNGSGLSVSVPAGIKKPLENRVWYDYQGGGGSTEGTVREVSGVGHVLDDGASQTSTYLYNSRGRMTQAIDSLGRETDYVYDATGLDRIQVKQKRGGTYDILETRTYNSQHEPLTITDAGSQTTTFTYNAAGQVLTVTNARNETTTYAYDGNGYLLSVTGALPGSTTTFTYDVSGRVITVTDSEGYVVTSTYDAASRPVQVAYPDGTTEQMVYGRLDVVQRKDRLGRITTYTYDANRRLVATRDPLGRTVLQEWCVCGTLDGLVDGNGNRTHWDYDIEGRKIRETRPNGSYTQYTYETTTSRLKQVIDPKAQVTTYTYALDDALLQTTYTNATIATPTVSFTYDTSYSRVATMVDGTGTTSYSYYVNASGQLGAGRVSAIDGPLTNDTITYSYDELGRVTSQAINSVAETTVYDLLGRTTGQTNVLGTFGYTYVGNTSRLSGVTYPNGQTTTYSYFGHTGDDRLQTIHHKYPNATTLSKFDYTYDAAANILTWQQQAGGNAPTVYRYGYDAADELLAAAKWTTDQSPAILKRNVYAYDKAGNRTSEQIDDAVTGATYDNMNRLASQQPAGGLLFAGMVSEPATVTVAGKLSTVNPDNTFSATVPVATGTNTIPVVATDPSGNSTTKSYQVTSSGATTSFTYDANGNVMSDGTRVFEWDAVNRLSAITQSSHRSEFRYDGVGRRVEIREKDSGVLVEDRYFIWGDNDQPWEEHDASGAVTKRFFERGVAQGTDLRYNTRDHLRSVNEITDAGATVRARYEYDPWGRATKVVGDLDGDFGFSGYFVHAPSGLDLTLARALDVNLGRWLSEDPAGFGGGMNFFGYVDNTPPNMVDPHGLVKVSWGVNWQFGDLDAECGGFDSTGKFIQPAGACTKNAGGAGIGECKGCGTNWHAETRFLVTAQIWVSPVFPYKNRHPKDQNVKDPLSALAHEYYAHLLPSTNAAVTILEALESRTFKSKQECEGEMGKAMKKANQAFKDKLRSTLAF